MYRSAQATVALLVLTAGLVFGGATPAHAAPVTATVDGFTFTALNVGGGATITGYTPGSRDVVIPATLTTGGIAYPVTTIGAFAFENDALTSVVIPNSVTAIGSYAFRRNALTSVVIPNSVNTIGSYAFYRNALTSVVIPNSVNTIGSYAFLHNSLTSVVIPDLVTTIGAYTFAHNPLTSVVIPNNVTTIGEGAFADNALLASVVIPNGVTDIGHYAFINNRALTSIVIPNSVTTIGEYAFAGGALTSVVIPGNVTTISVGAFAWSALTSVVIPNSVTTIGARAFRGNSLTSVVIPGDVTTIGVDAFRNNPSAWFLVPESVGNSVVAPLCTSVSDARTVTFDSVGGSAVSRAIACSALAVPVPVTPTRGGLLFAGWTVESSGGAPFDFNSPINSNTTGFAQWSAQLHPVTFNSQGGSAVAPLSYSTDVPVTLPAAPTRAGFTFTGWFVASSGGTALVGSQYFPGGLAAITLFAQWSPHSHTVTFSTLGGSAVAASTYSTGGSVTLPAAPARAGFTFNGWFAASSGGTALVSPYSPPGVGAVTVFAQWAAVSATVVPAVAAPKAPGGMAATGASLSLEALMGMAMLLLATGGLALLASRRRVGQRA